jgi:hypothetical protein
LQVSVIIVNWNGRALYPNRLGSQARQTFSVFRLAGLVAMANSRTAGGEW